MRKLNWWLGRELPRVLVGVARAVTCHVETLLLAELDTVWIKLISWRSILNTHRLRFRTLQTRLLLRLRAVETRQVLLGRVDFVRGKMIEGHVVLLYLLLQWLIRHEALLRTLMRSRNEWQLKICGEFSWLISWHSFRLFGLFGRGLFWPEVLPVKCRLHCLLRVDVCVALLIPEDFMQAVLFDFT